MWPKKGVFKLEARGSMESLEKKKNGNGNFIYIVALNTTQVDQYALR